MYSQPRMTRYSRTFFALLLVTGPFAWVACKKEEPPPTPAATEEEEEKPKKKKKKVDDWRRDSEAELPGRC